MALHVMEFETVGADGVRPKQEGACHAPLQGTYHVLTRFVGKGSPQVEKVTYSDKTAWIDKAKSTGFCGVPENVWNFLIGRYKDCEKWHKDRKGRQLSADDINHYHKIVVALNETIRLMGEVDKVIEARGCWPGAYVSDGKRA